MSKPALLKGRRHVKVPVATVMSVFKLIDDHGDRAAFVKATKDSNATFTVSPKLVNMVKQHLHEHSVHEKHALAKTVVGSSAAACPDYECPHIVQG